MKVVRFVVAAAATAALAVPIVQLKEQIGAQREPLTEETYGKCVIVTGALIAAIWVCAAGRR